MTAFWALVVFSFQRQRQVRQMALVAAGLLALLAVAVAVMSYGPTGWGLENRWSRGANTEVRNVPALLDLVQMTPNTSEGSALTMGVFAPFRAILADQTFSPTGRS